MNTLLVYLRLLTTVGIKRILGTFIAIFGGLWLFIEPASLLLRDYIRFGWFGYGGLVVGSLFAAILWRFPKRSISTAISAPDAVIEVKVGDLFNEPGHLVIGTNDVFDTDLGDIIKSSSIQGQFLTRVYHGDQVKLDRDIEMALSETEHEWKEDSRKKVGKSLRYPIGTTITLGSLHPRYFLTAYGFMSSELKCISDADFIWRSLNCLWEEIRLNGQGTPVSCPIIGSDLARTGLPRMALLNLIIISFIVASKKEFVTKKFTLVVHPDDLDFVNLYDVEEFLESVRF